MIAIRQIRGDTDDQKRLATAGSPQNHNTRFHFIAELIDHLAQGRRAVHINLAGQHLHTVHQADITLRFRDRTGGHHRL